MEQVGTGWVLLISVNFTDWMETVCRLKSSSQILHHLALFFSSNKYCLLGFIQNKIECEVLPQILTLPDWQRLSETHQERSQSCYF